MAVPTEITAPASWYNLGDTIPVSMVDPDPTVFHTWGWSRSNILGMGAGQSPTMQAPFNDLGITITTSGLSWVTNAAWAAADEGAGYVTATVTLRTWKTNPNPDGTMGNGDDNFTAGNLIGERVLAFTLYAATGNPTLSSLGLSEANSAVTAATIGAYVQGVSKLNWNFTAAGVGGASIVSAELEVAGQKLTGLTGTTAPIAASGTVAVTGRVTDSRGGTATLSQNITVRPWAPPVITSFLSRRSTSGGVASDTGTYLHTTFSATASTLPNSTERNKTGYTIKTRPRGGETWTTKQTATNQGITLSAVSFTHSTYPTDTAYEVRLEVTDLFGLAAAATFISKGGIVMDWGDGTVGIGKEWAQGTLDVGGDANVDGAITHRNGATVEPAGIISAFAGRVAPEGWLPCDGAAVSRTTYPALFNALNTSIGEVTVSVSANAGIIRTGMDLYTGQMVYFTTTGALPTGLLPNTVYYVIRVNADLIRLATTLANALAAVTITTSGTHSGVHSLWTTYGVGDGSTTFNVPNLMGRAPVGVDTAQVEFAAPGRTGGAKTHTLTVAEMPAHLHQQRFTLNAAAGSNMGGMAGAGSANVPGINSEQSTNNTGGGGAHNNLQPYIALNYIVKT